jgi:hypothetical protein
LQLSCPLQALVALSPKQQPLRSRVDRRTCIDAEKEKNLLPLPGIEPRLLVRPTLSLIAILCDNLVSGMAAAGRVGQTHEAKNVLDMFQLAFT